MGTKLSKAPVFYALAQAQISPVASMAEFVPAIQESLRKDGFPDYAAETHAVLALAVTAGASEQQIRPSASVPETRWTFQNASATEGFVLTTNSVVFHTTAYVDAAAFLARLKQGLLVVHKVVGLNFIDRLGIRFLDAVFPERGESLSAYLQPGAFGITELGGRRQQSFSECMQHTKEGVLVARVFIGGTELAVPPDLLPLRLAVNARFTALFEERGTLDTDHYCVSRMPFDIDKIMSVAVQLQNTLGDAFKSLTTEHARKVWA